MWKEIGGCSQRGAPSLTYAPSNITNGEYADIKLKGLAGERFGVFQKPSLFPMYHQLSHG